MNKVISCSYRMGGEKIKMFIYFFCWFAGDYIVIASLSIHICTPHSCCGSSNLLIYQIIRHRALENAM